MSEEATIAKPGQETWEEAGLENGPKCTSLFCQLIQQVGSFCQGLSAFFPPYTVLGIKIQRRIKEKLWSVPSWSSWSRRESVID